MGRRIDNLGPREMRPLRRDMQIVFQDPYGSLSPRLSVTQIIEEGLLILAPELGPTERRARVGQALEEVGLDASAQDRYPHEFSGGMRQRVVIAMALSCQPSLLIADEPTTALDVTIQAQILELLKSLQGEFGSSIILITHDMGVVSQMSDRVNVMYGGRLAEAGPRRDVLRNPLHPYTWGLMASIPPTDGSRVARLSAIPGAPISPSDTDRDHCLFSPRCTFASDACRPQPALVEHSQAHFDACVLPFEQRPELRRQMTAVEEVAP
jgi:peptide/nickel transport system ATP-binding protein